MSPSVIHKAVGNDDDYDGKATEAKIAVVVLLVPLCDRHFHLWHVESEDKVYEEAIIVFRLSA